MPGKRSIFRLPSILFRPHQQPASARYARVRRFLVEAPGTAPGSEELIASPVYRHSRLAATGQI